MQLATFEVTIPAPILSYGITQHDVQNSLNEWLVLQLFTENHISSGKAARLLGITRLDFLKLLQKRHISYIDYTPEELAEEFAAVRSIKTAYEKGQ